MVQRLIRLPDWRARFAAAMDHQRLTAFTWGQQDCVLGLAAGAVLALTGTDLTAGWRGRYRSERGARRVLQNAGFASLSDAIVAHLPEVHPDMADIGDLAVVAAEGPLGMAVAIFDTSGLIVMTEQGHGRLPRECARRAFKIG